MKFLVGQMIALASLLAQEGIPGPSLTTPRPPEQISSPSITYPIRRVEAEPVVPSAKFRISVSHQPLEVFKAAFLEKLPNVAMYDVLVCNVGDAPGAISGGIVMQTAASKVSLISRSLVEITAARARTKSKKYKAAEMAKWASIVGAMLVSGGTISASTDIAVIFPIVTAASDRLSKQFDQSSLPSSSLGQWLSADESFPLSPQACTSRLFLGGFKPGFQTATIEVK
jgi:hypothetical protein